MSLTARLDDEVIYAPRLTRERADQVQRRARDDRNALTHPGCGAPVSLRAGDVRAWHFAHLPGPCDPERSHEPESWQHRHLKRAIIAAARCAGWIADEEHRQEHGRWIADVHASDGQQRIAFEAQWSAQSAEGYRYRTQRYAAEGIRTIWLQSDFQVSDQQLREADLKLERWRVSVTGSEETPKATVRHNDQVLELDSFIVRLLRDDLPERVETAPRRIPEPLPERGPGVFPDSFRDFLYQARRASLAGVPMPVSPKERGAAVRLRQDASDV